MSITLPTTAGVEVTPALQVFGRPTQPIAGSRVQFLQRMGSRFRVTVSLPPLEYEDARAWLAARIRAASEGSTVVLEWPQPTQATLGTPLVNGGSQAGTSLICDGFTPSVSIPALAFFSFEEDSHHFLHTVTVANTANGSGEATLTIGPMLRVSPDNNAVLNFTAPKIEGFMDVGDVEWTLDLLMMTRLTFTISEDR